MKPLNLGWLSRRRDTVLPILLASVALLLSCDRRESLTAPLTESGQVLLAPRIVAESVPAAQWVLATLNVGGTTTEQKIQYKKGNVISLGRVPVGTSFTVTLAGYDSVPFEGNVTRWWGTSKLDTAHEVGGQEVSIQVTPADSVNPTHLSSMTAGSTIALGTDTLFISTLLDPRLRDVGSMLTGDYKPSQPGTFLVARRKTLASGVVLWSKVDTLVIKAGPVGEVPLVASALIKELALNAGEIELSPVFAENETVYSASVAAAVDSVELSVKLKSSTATLKVNGNTVTSAKIKVKAERGIRLGVVDGDSSRTYVLNIARRDSVAPPTFESGDGWVLDGHQVTLLPNSTSDEIHYTTNGTEPTFESEMYGGPITVTGDSLVIQAISFRDDDSSRVVSATFRIAREDTNTYGIPWNEALTKGRLIDTRDGHVYRTVEINGKTWMAQNLNYRAITGSNDTVGMCYNGNSDSCKKYGRIYQFASVSNVCPADWRLPDTTDWLSLRNGKDSAVAGRSLKSNVGWDLVPLEGMNNQMFGADGIDEFGFRGIPSSYSAAGTVTVGGVFFISEGGKTAQWWSSVGNGENAIASELKAGKSGPIGPIEVDGKDVYIAPSIFTISKRLTSTFVSVRCVKKTTP